MPSISPLPDLEGLISAYQQLKEYALPLESQASLQEIDRHLLSLNTLVRSLVSENFQMKQSNQQASETKQKFLSQVSHELRTPLTAIKGYSDLLSRCAVGPINEAQRKFLGVIDTNVNRMSELLSNLSDLSRLEGGRLKIQTDLVSIQDLVEQSLRVLLPMIEKKGQQLTIDLPTNLPDAYVDSERFVQVLTNLINNAHLYTASGGYLSIKASQPEKYIRFEVADNGCGISPEDQIHLFTPFFRSEDPLVRQEAGWGLGLYISKLLVELMGGEMGFSSTYARGSTFWFTQPIKQ